MMRAIEHGYKVRMIPCETSGLSVDTEEDRAEAEIQMHYNPLFVKLFKN